MRKPIVLLTLSYATGILFGNGFLYFPLSFAILGIIIVILPYAIARIRPAMNGINSSARFFLITLPFLGGMTALLYSVLWLPAGHYTRLVPEDKAVHRITGRIVSALDRDPGRVAFILDVENIDSHSASGRIRITIRSHQHAIIGYGDRVEVTGKLFSPGTFKNPRGFDFPAYLERQGIYRMVSIRNPEQVRVLVPGNGIFRTVQDWRERIRLSFMASITGPASAILQAMVLGEEGALTDEMRDLFLAAGVTHIISISGSHLGMAAALCFGFMRLLMRMLPERRYHHLTIHADPKKIAAAFTLPLVVFYTLLAGGQTATVRSLIMITAAMSALILDRESALLHALAAAALLVLLFSPQALFDISFQLSFLSVMTIASLVMLWSEINLKLTGRGAALLRQAALLVIVSFGATFATGPLVAYYFNQVSLAGLTSNIIVVPFAGLVVVPFGLVCGVLSLVTQSLPLAGLNQYLADRFLDTVSFFARLPIAEFHPRSPGILWLLSYTFFIISAFMVLRAMLLRKLRPFEFSSKLPRAALLGTAVSSAALIAISVIWFLPNPSAFVEFPDVGQGDAALIRVPGGRNILIDGGGSPDDRFDIGRRVLAPFLWNKGITRLDLVVLSHPHPDHMNGLKYILKKFNVREVWTHGLDEGLAGYDEFARSAEEGRVMRKAISASDQPVAIGDASLTVLHPGRGFRSSEKKNYAAENDRSIVLRVAFHDRVLLFAGDIGMGAEKSLVRTGHDLRCDLLKVPHHGSKSSSSPEFLAAARPAVAVFSVGRGNSYRHPAAEVVERYRQAGSRMYRTDADGAIAIRVDKGGMHGVAWNDLELKKMRVPGRWDLEQERQNWKRLWIRKWEL